MFPGCVIARITKLRAESLDELGNQQNFKYKVGGKQEQQDIFEYKLKYIIFENPGILCNKFGERYLFSPNLLFLT